MKTELSYKKTFTLLAVLAAVISICTLFFGDFVLPLASAMLAAVFVFENKANKILSYIISGLIVLANILMLFIQDFVFSLTGIAVVLFALIIYLSYEFNIKKTESSAYLTIAYVLLLIISLAFIAARNSGDYTLQGIITYYTDLYESFRAELILTFDDVMSQYYAIEQELLFTEEQMLSMIDTVFSLVISFACIIGFAFAGISLKLFSLIVKRISADETKILSWQFYTTNVFAYFFVVLFFVSPFITSYDTVLSVAILNLSNIFTVIYAYIGFKLTRNFLAERRNRRFANFIILLALLLFSSFTIQLLSLIGVFGNIRKNNSELPKDTV